MELIELKKILISQILPEIQDKETICIEQYFNKNVSSVFSLYYKKDITKQQIDIPIEVISPAMRVFRPVFLNPEVYSLPEWNTVTFEVEPNGKYECKFWNNSEKVKADELIVAKDFPHAMANHLVNHYLFATVKFKRKFERIIWTFWIKNGIPYFELYSINKKNQKFQIELLKYYEESCEKALLEHYEVTQYGILKDVWKPWNKIILSIPPNGYLNENEDIEYYLDDVKLEKDFFLRGY
jgi:hypothetical protein